MIDRDAVVRSWEKLQGDRERYIWLLERKDSGFILVFDKEDVFVTHESDENLTLQFDNHLWWSDGMDALMQAIGISAEPAV